MAKNKKILKIYWLKPIYFLFILFIIFWQA